MASVYFSRSASTLARISKAGEFLSSSLMTSVKSSIASCLSPLPLWARPRLKPMPVSFGASS